MCLKCSQSNTYTIFLFWFHFEIIVEVGGHHLGIHVAYFVDSVCLGFEGVIRVNADGLLHSRAGEWGSVETSLI